MPDQNATELTCLTVLLAAGQGTRMKSALPKVLHPVAGLPMVCHALDAAQAAGSSTLAVVVGHGGEAVAEAVKAQSSKAQIFEQTERLGTAHAVLAAKPALEAAPDSVLVLYGDVPLIRPETIRAALDARRDGASVVVLGFRSETPGGYGRLLTDGDDLLAIREEKDATAEERAVTFCNSGILVLDGAAALDLLEAVGNDNAQQEYYLTDVVEIARNRGLRAMALEVDEDETLGVNDRVQLAHVEHLWQQRRRASALRDGVSMAAPQTVFFHHDTYLASDVTVEPNVVFASGVSVAAGARIRAFSHLEGAKVGENCVVGPYARLRPGTSLEGNAKIGNFVETKNVEIGAGAKVNHLSYIGDATIGARANIGAGTITCNYDGFGKHRTAIGEDAFIGSNTALIAPVTIGARANTAAASAIAEDVPDDALAIERGKQANLEGKAAELRARNAKRAGKA